MHLIAHRGNYQGRNAERENSEEYILEALACGFEVEVDVWWHEESFWLGHDSPQYKTSEKFLENPMLWCHVKNLKALTMLQDNDEIHWFWHEQDQVTLTSKGYIWTYPGIYVNNSIVNQPDDLEALKKAQFNFLGICCDNLIEAIK